MSPSKIHTKFLGAGGSNCETTSSRLCRLTIVIITNATHVASLSDVTQIFLQPLAIVEAW